MSSTSEAARKAWATRRARFGGGVSRPKVATASGGVRRTLARTRGQQAYARRKMREQMMRDAGLVKVRGARGGVYWE